MLKSPYITVLRNIGFRRLLAAQITSQIALNMLSFILAIHVYQQTHSNIAVSLLLLTFGLPSLLFGIIAGGIVDNYDKKNILLFCNISRAFAFIGFFFFSNSLLAIYILAVVFSIITQFFIPAEGPSIPSLVEEKLLLTANSLFTISYYLSTIIGFVSAGPMLKTFGPRYVYMAMMGLMFLASFFVWQLPHLGKNVKYTISLESIWKMLEEGILFIKSNTRVRQSLILMTFAQALIITLSVLSPGFADKVLSIDLTDASYLVMGPAGLGLVLGALLIGEYGRKFLKGSIILVGIVTTGFILILLSFLTRAGNTNYILDFWGLSIHLGNLAFAIIFLLLLGFFNAFISIPASTILQEDSEGQLRGRVYGVLTSLIGGVSVIPVIFSGILADVVGVGRTLSYIGMIVLVVGIYHYYQRRRAVI